jgi:LEA14-like dessication related protein
MKKYSNWMRAASVLLVMLGISSCASTPDKLQPPRLTVVSASMTSADVFSQQFRVRIHVANPNTVALPVKSIHYELFLEGDDFADGDSDAPFSVPANGEQEFDLTVRTHFVSSIGRLLSRLSGSNRAVVQYTFSGHVVVDKMFSPKLNFAESGAVDLSRR